MSIANTRLSNWAQLRRARAVLISAPHDAEDLTTPDCKRQIGDSGDGLEMHKNLQLVEMVLLDGGKAAVLFL